MVIGDVMIDAYMWGKVNRISPEAPVPIVAVDRLENRLGGAANVSLNVQALGAIPLTYAVIGDDEKGNLLRQLFKDQSLSDEGIIHYSKKHLHTNVLPKNLIFLKLAFEAFHCKHNYSQYQNHNFSWTY